MSGKPFNIALPPNLDLKGNCEIRVTALDPDTGVEMSGVSVFDMTLEVDAQDTGDLAYGPFVLVTGPSG